MVDLKLALPFEIFLEAEFFQWTMACVSFRLVCCFLAQAIHKAACSSYRGMRGARSLLALVP